MSAALHVALLAPPGLPIDAFAQALAQRLADAPLRLRVAIWGPDQPSNADDSRHLLLHLGHDASPLARCDSALLVTQHGAAPAAEDALRAALSSRAARWGVVRGTDAAALEAAVDALTPWLLHRPSAATAGLFSRLEQREAAQPAWNWVCDSCDSPECEHASLQARRHAEDGPAPAPQR